MPVTVVKVYCRRIERNAVVIGIVIRVVVISRIIAPAEDQKSYDNAGEQERDASK